MNEHINSFLKHYIELNIPPEYALLLFGEWGSGKTFFINNFLQNEEQTYSDKVKFIKVSLFGINSLESIDEQVFQQLHPILGSKPIRFAANLAKNALKYGAKIDWDGDAKADGTISVDLKEFSVFSKDDKKSKKEIVFIFDDLERTKLNISDVLGYINVFVEQLSFKVIILANENKIIEKDTYKDFKEKLIGKSFQIAQDFESAFKTFIELTNFSKKIMIENKTIIENIFITANYNNLRHIRQSLLDFEHFFENIEEKFHTKKELMQELVEIFFAFSIEVKNGTFDIQDLKDLQHVESMEYYMERMDAKEEKNEFIRKPLDLLLEKYSLTNREGLLLTEKMWIELFNFGTLKQSDITESFENSKYFAVESPKEWVPLWHYHELEDSDFKEKLEVVVNNFNNNQYKEHEVFMHVVGILLRLSELQLYDETSTEIIDKAKDNIDKNLEVLEKNIDLDVSSFGLSYMGAETDEFIDVKNYLVDKTYEAINNSLEDSGLELIELLKDNNFEEFINKISKSFVVKLHELPVFSKIDTESFFNAILNIKHTTLRKILPTIEKRYSQIHINELLIDELEFWKEFEKLLDSELPKRKKTVKGVWLNILKDRVIKDKILNKLQKAKDDKALNQTEDSVG